MLIDFQKPILDLYSDPILFREAVKGHDGEILKPAIFMKLMHACQEGLGAAFQDEANLSEEEKKKRFLLAVRIMNLMPVEISIKEAAEIERLVNKRFAGSVIYPRVAEIFDAATT